jgi:serine/threonine-protein kinase RsbW
MELAMKHLTLEIESNLSDVSLVAVAINAICAFAGMARDNASQVELSLVEAVTNSIRHAYYGEPDHKVTINITFDDEHLRFDLYDTGTPMQAEAIDRLVRGHGIVESKNFELVSIAEDGRGLEIIHRTMDEIGYTRQGGRNHLTLIRYLAQNPR